MKKEAALKRAKKLIAEGKVVIGNEAAKAGANEVVVRPGWRKGTIIFQWSRPGIGFGELIIRAGANGKLTADTEAMSDQFCLDVIAQALREKE